MRYAFLLPLFLSACAAFPALDETINEEAAAAPYPELTPLPTVPQSAVTEQAGLQARIDALQARATRLRQIDIGALQ